MRSIRFYEQKGFLKPARIGQRRFYSENDEARLALVLRGKHLGLSLMEIQKLIFVNNAPKTLNDSGIDLTASLLPRSKILEKITHLTKLRTEIDEALTELKQVQMRQAVMAGTAAA